MSKLQKWTTQRVNPNVNYEFWMITIYPCRLNTYKNYILVRNVDNGGGYACGEGAGSVWETLYLLLSFAANLKLL